MPFLGFRVLPDKLLLGRRARRRFCVRVAQYEQAWDECELDDRGLQRRVDALIAHTDVATCHAWRRRAL
ncbi:MAG: hypothetical protein ACI9UA_003999, partial [Pseudoalteromonas tetraodonis]